MPEEPKEFCPECGADLTDRDPIGHANDHWPPTIQDKDLGKDALKRKQILLKMAEKRGK